MQGMTAMEQKRDPTLNERLNELVGALERVA